MLYIGLVVFTPLFLLLAFGLYINWLIDQPEKTESRHLTHRELSAIAKHKASSQTDIL
jgi:hypothetical protein